MAKSVNDISFNIDIKFIYLKMKFRKVIILFLIFSFMVACVSPYYPNITKYENLLVVDGQLTNLTGPYSIKLSRTFRYDGGVGEKVTGATIKFIDNTGFEILLKEISTGVYSTVDTLFHGIPGRSYKIQIKDNNDIFESDFEILKTPLPIDKINWEYKPQDSDSPKRIQILLDAHDPTNNTRYYGWEYIETWKFKEPLDVVRPFKPEWKICYQTNSSSFINLGTTIERNNDVIDKQVLKTIDENTNRLYIRYSILARQYSFTERTYKYLDDLTKLNQNQGTLFDPTPYSLTGNIKCVNNKNIPVVGYFVVAGAAEKRIFIDRSDLPTEYNPTNGFNGCSPNIIFVDAAIKDYRLNRQYDSLTRLGYSVYDTLHVQVCKPPLPPPGVQCTTMPAIQMSLAKSICFNCTLTGDNKVPAFWTEKIK